MELSRLTRDDRQAACVGAYLFRYLEERLGVSAVDVAMLVSALLALAGALLATIAPGWLIASTPFAGRPGAAPGAVELRRELDESAAESEGLTPSGAVDAPSTPRRKGASAMTDADKMAIAGEAIDAVAAGGTQRRVAAKYGVSTSVLSKWVKRRKAQRAALAVVEA